MAHVFSKNSLPMFRIRPWFRKHIQGNRLTRNGTTLPLRVKGHCRMQAKIGQDRRSSRSRTKRFWQRLWLAKNYPRKSSYLTLELSTDNDLNHRIIRVETDRVGSKQSQCKVERMINSRIFYSPDYFTCYLINFICYCTWILVINSNI